MVKQSLMVIDGDVPAELFEEIRHGRVVAWDIETTSLDWTSGRIATCQLAMPDMVLIMKLAPETRPRRLRELLADPSITKIFHHAPFDLRFMAATWAVSPAGVRCTKIASKILDPDLPADAHSLRPVLKRHLDVDIDKGQQTSDWASPTLSDEQLRYAANDVIHLIRLLDHLVGRLEALGRRDLLDASYAYLPARVRLDLLGSGDVYAY